MEKNILIYRNKTSDLAGKPNFKSNIISRDNIFPVLLLKKNVKSRETRLFCSQARLNYGPQKRYRIWLACFPNFKMLFLTNT